MAGEYQREKGAYRLAFTGIDTVHPLDSMPTGKTPYAQNVRCILAEATAPRPTLDSAAVKLDSTAGPVHSIRRLNDSTPNGPASGYVIISGSGTRLNANGVQVDSGLSGNPISLLPFRPNTSVQPWMYVGDSLKMDKVRSDGLRYKTGIKEPQVAPTVSIKTTSTVGSASLPATTRPWSNVGGVNSFYNYGDTGDGTAPVIIATPLGSTVTLTVTGTATVNGTPGTAPSASGPQTSGYPGAFITGTCKVIVCCFTDGSGNIVAAGSIPNVASVGASVTLNVPSTATQLQVGIDSHGGTFSSNSGAFSLSWTVTTGSVSNKVCTVGNVTTWYWGDSPHSGPVAGYIWQSPNDGAGWGPTRSTSSASGSATGNSLIFDSTPSDGSAPVLWTTLNPDGTVASTSNLFAPALESQGYQDFNCCITGALFIPAAGTYTVAVLCKDDLLLGIGGGATWPGKGSVRGTGQQRMTVVSQLPLCPTVAPNGAGAAQTSTVSVTFPSAGVYQIEIDWDYWYHAGRTLVMTVNGAAIPPLPQDVRTNVEYRCTFRSSVTGAVSNPSPASSAEALPTLSNVVTPPYSDDPQVDKVDFYRQDDAVTTFSYVGTGPNTNPPTSITDTLLDSALTGAVQLAYDNFEPFPSIDLPRKGVVNVSGGVISWVSGDKFNTRWLPGTTILIGSPTSLAYETISRPSSTTQMTISGVPDGINLAYEIPEPGLAAQPLPYLWGPTDNVAFMFGCGDPLRPGTLYWTKGNNPDSAPDTNQQEVTSPSEPLQNGCIVNGIGLVFSTERAWLIYPNFFNALATVTGTQGSTWTLQETITNRGLYIPTCLAVDGGRDAYFRAKDGWYLSPSGQGSQSITDDDIYNLFVHEGKTPQPISRCGFTIYPPDDTKPQLQRAAIANGYLYWDYQGTDGNPHTLVYDMMAKGWVVDAYQYPVRVHALEEGANVNNTLVGCSDGSIRPMIDSGIETATSVLVTPSYTAGDIRSQKHFGDLFIEAGTAQAVD